MNSLKKYKLDELYQMGSGISTKPEQAGHGAPFCSFSTVFNNYFLPPVLPEKMDTTEAVQCTYSLLEGDVLLTRTSETLDELGMSSVAAKDYPSATFSGFLKRLRPIRKGIAYPKYMAFYLRSPLFRKAMNNNAVMTLRCSLNEEIFSYLSVLLPSFDQQIKIGDFLYQIYAKIELNQQMNEELEGMAKLLYDYWFVQYDFPMSAAQATALGKPHLQGRPYRASGGPMAYHETLKREIPKGWCTSTLGKIFNLYQPQTLTGDDLKPNGKYLVYGANGIIGKYDRFNHEHPKIALTCRGSTCGNLTRTLPFSWITGNAMVMDPRDANLDIEYVYNVAKSAGIEAIITGSGQPQITRANLEGVVAVSPDSETIGLYQNFVAPITKQRIALELQTQELTTLRDWLLPMLMNGQVTVQ